jgi:hypothetical protein
MIFNFKVGALENQLKFKTRRGPHVTHLAPSYCMHWSPPSFHTLRAHPASPVPTALPVTVVTSRRRRHRPMCAPPYPRRCPYPPSPLLPHRVKPSSPSPSRCCHRLAPCRCAPPPLLYARYCHRVAVPRATGAAAPWRQHRAVSSSSTVS